MLISNLTYGYGHGVFNPKDKAGPGDFVCSYSRAERAHQNFQEECIQTAHLISEEANRRAPMIMLSGGMDSEVVVKAFIDAGLKFEIFTFRYKDGLNDHEMQNVQKFCTRHGLKPNYLDIDVLKWMHSSEAAHLFVQSCSTYFAMLPHMKLMNHIHELGGLPILGNGEVLLERAQSGWAYVELEYDLAWYRHAIANEIPAACGFFQHTAEIQLAALKNELLVQVVDGRNKLANQMLLTTKPVKYQMYQGYWPDLRIRAKYDGTEKIRPFSMKRTTELQGLLLQSYDSKFLIPYDEMISTLEFQGSVDHPSRS